MDTSTHLGFHQGQPVEAVSDDSVLMAGIITKLGSAHAEVTGYDGNVAEVPYGIMRAASLDKTAQRNRIKEEEKDGQKFALDKEEKNIDNKMSIRYKVTVDGKEIWSSEELVTNVYDNEFGWSAPDDFDEGKLDLIQKTAESGFDLLVESFKNIQELAAPGAAPSADGKEAPAPEGKPAFAPGAKGDGGAGDGGMGGGGMGGGDVVPPAGEPETTGVEGETVSDTGVPVEETEKASPEIPAEAETAEPVSTAASLDKQFSRRIVSDKKGDQRLHNNPEHRLNPVLRDEMKRRNIDSGNTNDLELADKLKDFDWSKKGSIKTAAMYATINDAAEVLSNPSLAEGTTEIWYTTFDSMRDFGMGYDWLEKQMIIPTKESLPTTHKLIGKIKETNLEKIVEDMQGENWSPEGQARDLVKGSGASHTSMSVGDIIVIGDTGYLVDRFGFKPLWGSVMQAAKKTASGSYDVSSDDFIETILDEDEAVVTDTEDTCPACGSKKVDFSGQGISQDSYVYYPMTCKKCGKTSKAWYNS